MKSTINNLDIVLQTYLWFVYTEERQFVLKTAD